MVTSSNDPQSRDPKPRAVPRVLIADQSPEVIERLAASIDDVAQVVARATNARDAIHFVRTANPHLMVFDVAIPNGTDLLKYIKSDQPQVITVILTHSVEETTRQYCLRLGAEYFLDKIREFDKVREIVIAIGSGIGSGWGRGAPGS